MQPLSHLSVESLSPALWRIHERLPESGAVAVFRKNEVSLRKLNQIGRVTGDEYNVFTLGSRRTVIRGYGNEISVSWETLDDIYSGRLGRFSGHTHPPSFGLEPGPQDRPFIIDLETQKSAIWRVDPSGNSSFRLFGQLPVDDEIINSEIRK